MDIFLELSARTLPVHLHKLQRSEDLRAVVDAAMSALGLGDFAAPLGNSDRTSGTRWGPAGAGSPAGQAFASSADAPFASDGSSGPGSGSATGGASRSFASPPAARSVTSGSGSQGSPTARAGDLSWRDYAPE